MHWIIMPLASIVTFTVLLSLVRWIGETQISQATYFNWVAGACMGNVAANLLTAGDFKDMGISVIQLTLFSGVTILASLLSLKNKRFRKIASGEPVVLIHEGNFIYPQLKKCRIDEDLLKQMLREQGYFNYREIQYGILEPTGSLSILPTSKSSESGNPISQKDNPQNEKRKESQNIK